MTRIGLWVAVVALTACGGGGGAGDKDTTGTGGGGETANGGGTENADPPAKSADPNAEYAPLDVATDWSSWAKVNKETFLSPTHGKRFVDIYVNDTGKAAYTSDAEFPVGSMIVKSSFETKDGQKTDVAGPLFIMVKKEKGFDPEHEDWWYGFHWENVPDSWSAKLGKQVYWRSPSAKVNYCWNCHDNFDREIGLPPKEQRNWEEK